TKLFIYNDLRQAILWHAFCIFVCMLPDTLEEENMKDKTRFFPSHKRVFAFGHGKLFACFSIPFAWILIYREVT
ncbi:MAG: hypothetical protein AAB649_02925, partial [Patescibacteria group bacterium]